MRLEFTARSDAISNNVKSYAEEKANRLDKYFEGVHSIQIVMNEEHGKFHAEMVIAAARGNTIVGEVQDQDPYAAIDLLVDKMARLLKRAKEKIKDHHRGERAMSNAEMPAAGAGPERAEETYEEAKEHYNPRGPKQDRGIL
ncbi:MAG: ribosome-associated translation inhibitor RaiA [Planctomycetes bacterium]|nr:ribosome-associated translation inhibitor RaiA [Planctomycetota bacterium]